MKVSIIGTGIYGLSLAINIVNNGYNVMMWSENKELVNDFKNNHKLNTFTNKDIPKEISLTNSLRKCINNTELIIIATSAKYVRSICEEIKEYYNSKIDIIIASKGIEIESCSFLSDIVTDILNTKRVGVISGPTFAKDLINLEPCALNLATKSNDTIKKVSSIIKCENIKLRCINDLYGTELVGSVKNIIAISSGIIEGLGYKESTRAFLITESIYDIKELLINLNGDVDTILSYAGIGDLMLTAGSNKSRNYQFGVLIGKNEKQEVIDDFLKNNTVEGFYTIKAIKKIIDKNNLNTPLINVIYDIIINKNNPKILTEYLTK